jgi:hypothetical protein
MTGTVVRYYTIIIAIVNHLNTNIGQDGTAALGGTGPACLSPDVKPREV